MTSLEVRRYLGRQVSWRGKEYTFTGCILRLDKGDFVYQAEITEYRESMTTVYIAALDELQPKS